MYEDITQDDALVIQRELTEDLLSKVQFTMTGQGKPSESLVKWVSNWLTRRANLEGGACITPLLWVPSPLWHQIGKCIMGQGPYSDMNLFMTVKNMASSPVDVTYNVINRSVPIKGKVGTWVEGDTWRGIPQIKRLQPGDTAKLPCHYGVLSMQTLSELGWDPMLWGESGSIPQTRTLVEVAYSVYVNGEIVESQPPRREAKASHRASK